MGCALGTARVDAVVPPQLVDLRYDEDGFRAWADQHIEGRYAIAWLKVGFIKFLARENMLLPHRQALERIACSCHVGAPPSDAQLYYTSFGWQGPRNRDVTPTFQAGDPEGFVLQDVAKVLMQEGARDTDLVFIMPSSMFLCSDSGVDLKRVPEDSCVEKRLYTLMSSNFLPMLCYWKVRTILLPRMYSQCPESSAVVEPIHRVWFMADVVIAAYCQRLLSVRSDEKAQDLIRLGADPGRLCDCKQLFLEQLQIRIEEERTWVWNMVSGFIKSVTPIKKDHVGFDLFCKESQLAWLKVAYVKELAERTMPFPRRQDLRHGAYWVGSPPTGVQKFVVSHAWETEVHPNPGGGKLARLVIALLEAGASDDDAVFLDFCALSQENKMGRMYEQDEPWDGMPARDASAGPYFEEHFKNSITYYPDRSAEELRSFQFALWEMGRLYAFTQCQVIVLPMLFGPAGLASEPLPGGDVWGLVNQVPYQNRGWCCAEFSIALQCGTIKNLTDPDVQQVLSSREWPRDVQSYSDMMRRTTKRENESAELSFDPERGVDFTNQGDREVVKYNFFKMALALDGAEHEMDAI